MLLENSAMSTLDYVTYAFDVKFQRSGRTSETLAKGKRYFYVNHKLDGYNSDFSQQEMRNDLRHVRKINYTENYITEFCNASHLNTRHIALISEDP